MKSIALALVLLTASAARAQMPADPSGHWKGTIDIPNNPMDFEVDFGRNSDGELIGTITAGVDRATGPLIKVALDGRTLTFFGRADQPLEAILSDSGITMSGTAGLSGYSLPFGMTRTGDAHIEPEPTSPAVTRALEGKWHGVLATGTADYHLALTIANRPDGTAVAYSVSLDEGGLRLPVVVAQKGSIVQLETRGVVTSYTGTLNATGTEIIGTWTQRTTSLPLTLTRTAAEGRR